jgi:hypothetical protein
MRVIRSRPSVGGCSFLEGFGKAFRNLITGILFTFGVRDSGFALRCEENSSNATPPGLQCLPFECPSLVRLTAVNSSGDQVNISQEENKVVILTAA